jgi:hypothetical protein
MFLCDPCHAKANCPTIEFEDTFSLRSRGACEVCHTSASCVDCHNYGQVKPPRRSRPPRPYATSGTVIKLSPAKGVYQAGEIGQIKGDDGRIYQFSGFGAKTGPGYHLIYPQVGDRVSFEVLHVGGEGFLKYPFATGLERLPPA